MLDEECIHDINLTLSGNFYCSGSYNYDEEEIAEECVVDDYDDEKYKLKNYLYNCDANNLNIENIFSSDFFINSISKSIEGTLYDECHRCSITRFIQNNYL